MLKIIFALSIAMALASPALGKIYSRCELAREMYELGVPKEQLPRWTCTALYESGYNTAVVHPSVYLDGSYDYGIFQINSKDYCAAEDGSGRNACNVKCTDLLTDNIEASVKCAQLIQQTYGWWYWFSWRLCEGNSFSVDECFE